MMEDKATELLLGREFRDDDDDYKVYTGEFCYATGKGDREHDHRQTSDPLPSKMVNKTKNWRRNRKRSSSRASNDHQTNKRRRYN